MLYSNSGLSLATTMAERVAGEPHEIAAGRFYRERLGLRSWGVWAMNAPEDWSHAWSHFVQEGVLTPRPPRTLSYRFVRPSGSAHSTISDVVRFGLLATGTTPFPGLLSASTWTTIHSPHPNSENTLGSFSLDLKQGRFSHGGVLTTTRSHLAAVPNWKVSWGALHQRGKRPNPRARRGFAMGRNSRATRQT